MADTKQLSAWERYFKEKMAEADTTEAETQMMPRE